jgi:hypothetical protein
VPGVPEKAIFLSVTVHNKHLSSRCNLPAHIEQVQDKIGQLIHARLCDV